MAISRSYQIQYRDANGKMLTGLTDVNSITL